MNQHSPQETQHVTEQKRPLWLIGIACFMIIYQIFWLVRVLQLPDNLKTTMTLLIPLEVIISVSIVIGITYGIQALIAKKEWAIRFTAGIMSIQIGYVLLRLIIFAEADYDRQRLPFLVILFSVVYGLWLLPKVLKFIHKSTKGEEIV